MSNVEYFSIEMYRAEYSITANNFMNISSIRRPGYSSEKNIFHYRIFPANKYIMQKGKRKKFLAEMSNAEYFIIKIQRVSYYKRMSCDMQLF